MLGETKGSIFSPEFIFLCTNFVQPSCLWGLGTCSCPESALNRDGACHEHGYVFCRHTKSKKKTANNGKEEVTQENYQEARNQSTDLL